MRQAAWWPCWWGAFFFLLILSINFGAGYKFDLLPGRWDESPFEAWEDYVVASVVGLIFAGLIVLPGLEDMAVQKGSKWTKLRGKPLRLNLFGALTFSMFIAIVAYIIGSQTEIKGVGLGAEFWAILIGIIIINSCAHFMEKTPEFLTLAAAMGEDIIKLGLILLGIDLQTLAGLGLPGIVVGVPVTIVVLSTAYAVGSRMVKANQRRLCMILCGGLSVCGASAATAVQSVIGGTSQELTLSISVVTIFTIVQMIALPYIALAAQISKGVIAAALGGCVNSTGSVVAAAGFLGDQEYVNIAAAVKIIQNAFLGFVAVGVAVYWAAVEEKHGSAWSKELKKEQMRNRNRSSAAAEATFESSEEASTRSSNDSLHSSSSDSDSGDDIKLDILEDPPASADASAGPADVASLVVVVPSTPKGDSDSQSSRRRSSSVDRVTPLPSGGVRSNGKRKSFSFARKSSRSRLSVDEIPLSSSAPGDDHHLSAMEQIAMPSSAPMKYVLGESSQVNFSSSAKTVLSSTHEDEHSESKTTSDEPASAWWENVAVRKSSASVPARAYARSQSSNLFTHAMRVASKVTASNGGGHRRNESMPVVMDLASLRGKSAATRRESSYMPIKVSHDSIDSHSDSTNFKVNHDSIGSLSDNTNVTGEQFIPTNARLTRRPSATDFIRGKTEVRWYQMFWRKFPKFVLGFLTLSICLTIIRAVDPGTHAIEEESVFNTMKSQMQDASRWFFTLGFVGIGLSSEFKSLYSNLMGGADLSKMSAMQKLKQASRFIGVYWFGQLFNIVLTFAVSYAMFRDFEVGDL